MLENDFPHGTGDANGDSGFVPAAASPSPWSSPDSTDVWPTPSPVAAPPRSSMTGGTRLVITEEDLADPRVDEQVRRMAEAHVPPMSRTVGTPTAPSRRMQFGRTMATMGGLGLAGGFLGYLLAEIIGKGDTGRFTNPTQATMLFTTLFTVGLGVALIAWDGLEARNASKIWMSLARGLPIVVGGGALGGALAQQIYYPFVRSAVKNALARAGSSDEAVRMVQNSLRFPRAIAFMLVGLCIGAGLGVVYRSWRRAQNGLIGGAVGGFIGGLMFDWVGQAFHRNSGALSRAVALMITGVLIGLAVGAVDVLRKQAWLHIVSGGMAGKQFIIFRDRCVIGSGGDADVTLIKDPSIAPSHVELSLTPGGGARFRSLAPHLPVALNGVPAAEGTLSDGSLLQVGKTVLQFGMKSVEMPTYTTP